ncbi:MAG: class I SAM-dependent methyltransferase [Desulfomonile tiedjei]|nr:class I SAM-dependent methyltransferase [Desulfomonile tiedjei]
MLDPAFCRAYERGVTAEGVDYRIHWRIHVVLWVARSASKVDGDFVECGVNRGFRSSAIMEYLDWDALGKTFYLLDTFSGVDARYVTEEDVKAGVLERSAAWLKNGTYINDVESVRANFSRWKNLRIMQGPVPESLDSVESERIAYLHLDMNCSLPEVEAFKFFWDRLVPGAFVLLDDYCFKGHETQKSALDAVVKTKDADVLSLPTGQGLVIKSPDSTGS